MCVCVCNVGKAGGGCEWAEAQESVGQPLAPGAPLATNCPSPRLPHHLAGPSMPAVAAAQGGGVGGIDSRMGGAGGVRSSYNNLKGGVVDDDDNDPAASSESIMRLAREAREELQRKEREVKERREAEERQRKEVRVCLRWVCSRRCVCLSGVCVSVLSEVCGLRCVCVHVCVCPLCDFLPCVVCLVSLSCLAPQMLPPPPSTAPTTALD